MFAQPLLTVAASPLEPPLRTHAVAAATDAATAVRKSSTHLARSKHG